MRVGLCVCVCVRVDVAHYFCSQTSSLQHLHNVNNNNIFIEKKITFLFTLSELSMYIYWAVVISLDLKKKGRIAERDK